MIFESVITLFYILLFCIFISRWKFFSFEGLTKPELTLIFFIKIIAGLLLIIIYSRYYIIRGDADIFKYFDDSEKIYNVLFINPIHYLRLVFGINADSEQLQKYMEGTYVWALQTSDYQHFIASEKIDLFNSHRLITRVNAVIRLFSSGCFGVHTVF
ncbi:MAG: hypothetical protein PHR81_00230, partial [Bacteroidales bacterium]|nr:hypothetical protein [Bacteroidales bacterium]